jgi:adenylate cyclase
VGSDRSVGGYESAGLLDGCEGEARSERVGLLDQLFADGAPLDEVRGAIAEDRLVMLRVEQVLAGEPKYTSAEIAARAGVSPEFWLKLRQAAGLGRPESDERVFSDHDLEAADLLARFLAAGMTQERLLEVLRVFGRGLAQGAHAVRAALSDVFLSAGVAEDELAARNAEAADQLLPLAGPLLQFLLRLHLLDQIRRDTITMSELRSARRLPGTRHVGVAFADLVGFTGLGERRTVHEVGEVATRLEELASDVVEPPVTLVKTIGDAVMLVASEEQPLVETALALVERADDHSGEGFPPLRAGVACGTAFNRSGDWYGRPVNLASRVTGAAPGGAVVCTAEVRDALGDRYRWTELGARQLKGIEGETALFRVERQTELS